MTLTPQTRKNKSDNDLMQKWDTRYKNASSPGEVAPVLAQFKQLIPQKGKALDLACGLGANALYLATQHLDTYAWDISTEAIHKVNEFAKARGLQIKAETRNIDCNPPTANSFDLIIVTHFLSRSLCKSIYNALKPNGVLFYQTYLKDKLTSKGPSNSEFLLDTNELLSLFPGLIVKIYQEIGSYSLNPCNNSILTHSNGLLDTNTAMMIGQKPK